MPLRIHTHAAQRRMRRGRKLDPFLCDIYAHIAIALDIHLIAGCQPGRIDTGNIHVDAAVLRALAARDLRYDAAAHHILADAVALRAISQHEAFAVAVSQHRALKEQRGNYAGAHQLTGPYRRAGLKLDELHIAKLCAGLIGHGHTVAAGISLVRGNGIDAAIAAACQHHRIRPEIQPPLSRGVIRQRAAHTAAILQQLQRTRGGQFCHTALQHLF